MLVHSLKPRLALLPTSRCIRTITTSKPMKAKEEGDISSVFSSLSGAKVAPLPERFASLKQEIAGESHEALIKCWADLIGYIAKGVHDIRTKGSDVIPEVSFAELTSSSGASAWVDEAHTRGSLVVRDVVPDTVALEWKEQIKEYVRLNPNVKGFPPENKQVFEIYWSKSQVQARSHPNVLATQYSILQRLFRTETGAHMSLNTPVTYADRLRIRLPGDAKFALGPHIDGGSLERWEDYTYRQCYKEILSGRWREHDPWNVGRRIGINSDMYSGPSQCSVFRAMQGWLSLSSTGPNEGTLRVFPLLKEASAYVLLRPFFKTDLSPSSPEYLKATSWRVDTESTEFPNSMMGCAQELSEVTHPHLRLGDGGMVSMKHVNPGDMVFWHCDNIHAVEAKHRGLGDSSVFYIPITPLTKQNAEYLARQRESFVKGAPPPDFPGGIGEAHFIDRGLEADLADADGRRAMGLGMFTSAVHDKLVAGELEVVEEANRALSL